MSKEQNKKQKKEEEIKNVIRYYSYILAKRAFKDKKNISKKLEVEYLLYLYKTRNIKKALSKAKEEKETIEKVKKATLKNIDLEKLWREIEERAFLYKK